MENPKKHFQTARADKAKNPPNTPNTPNKISNNMKMNLITCYYLPIFLLGVLGVLGLPPHSVGRVGLLGDHFTDQHLGKKLFFHSKR